MGKKLQKSLRKAKKMSDKPIPGGYKTFQLIDEIKMTSVDIKKDIEATTRLSIDGAEFYRLLARFTLKIQEIDKSVGNLEKIIRNEK